MRLLPALLVLATLAAPAAADAKVRRTPTKDVDVQPVLPQQRGTPPSRLTRLDIVEGDGTVARTGDAVTVRFVTQVWRRKALAQDLWTGKEVDPVSGELRGGFPFTIGDGGVIKGFSSGVRGMRVGGRRQVVVPPGLAYGRRGAGSRIPRNATLVFVVDLLQVVPAD